MSKKSGLLDLKFLFKNGKNIGLKILVTLNGNYKLSYRIIYITVKDNNFIELIVCVVPQLNYHILLYFIS